MRIKTYFIYMSFVTLLGVVDTAAVWADTLTYPANLDTSLNQKAQNSLMVASANVSDGGKQPVVAPEENTLKTYGLLQGDFFAYDSARHNTPDFQGTKARVGTVIENNTHRVSAQIEIEYDGNTPDTTYLTNIYSIDSEDEDTQPTGGYVSLRQAQINFDALVIKDNDQTYTTRVSAGGVRIGGADYTAPDAAYVPNGFSRQDGIWLQEMTVLSNRFSFDVGFGLFNGLYAANIESGAVSTNLSGWGAVVVSKSDWHNVSLNENSAYVFTSDATLKLENKRALRAVLDYGNQQNAPAYLNSISGNVLDTGYVNDVEHAEASLLYLDPDMFGTHGILSGNGVSAYWEMENKGRSLLASSNGGSNSYNYTKTAYNDYADANLYGISIAGDTADDKSLSQLMTGNDRLTYALAGDFIHLKSGENDCSYCFKQWIKTSNTYQIAGSVGYGLSTMEVALNAEYAISSAKNMFQSTTGYTTTDQYIAPATVNNGQNTSTQIYLAFAYGF